MCLHDPHFERETFTLSCQKLEKTVERLDGYAGSTLGCHNFATIALLASHLQDVETKVPHLEETEYRWRWRFCLLVNADNDERDDNQFVRETGANKTQIESLVCSGP